MGSERQLKLDPVQQMKKTLKIPKTAQMPEFTIYLVHLDLRVSVFSGLNLGNDFSFWTSIRSCFRKYKGGGFVIYQQPVPRPPEAELVLRNGCPTSYRLIAFPGPLECRQGCTIGSPGRWLRRGCVSLNGKSNLGVYRSLDG